MIVVLNKKNLAYIEGKRKKTIISWEAYVNLATQIKEISTFSFNYRGMLEVEGRPFVISGMQVGCIFMFFLTFFLFISLGMLYNLIFFLLFGAPKVSNIPLQIGAILFTMSFSVLFFQFLRSLYLNFITRVQVGAMRKLVQKGTLVIGHVEGVHTLQRGKSKINGNRKINIEYTFRPPNRYIERGVFMTSEVKTVVLGDEVAVWYIDEFLHILL